MRPPALLLPVLLVLAAPAVAQSFGDALKRTVQRAAESEVQRRAEQETRDATRRALGDERCRRDAARGVASSAGASSIARGGEAVAGGDHPRLPRYEGATLVRREADDFTDYPLRTGKAKASGTQVVEGALTRLTYQGPPERSVLEVYRNYEDALKRDGFAILFACAREACGDIRKDIESGPRYMLLYGGGEHRYLAATRSRDGATMHVALWVTRNSGGGPAKGRAMVQLDIVESATMDARMTVVDADAMRRDLADDGRVALYGIEFDVDRDTLRPEADTQIAQVAALLRQDTRLSVRVEGHTDDRGGRDQNLALSRRRAQRVVDALATRHGIARTRMEAVGRGASAPLAPNDSEDGRAGNRRVEIVRR